MTGIVAPGAPLVLHEEISTPENKTFQKGAAGKAGNEKAGVLQEWQEEAWREGGCGRWPETMRLVSSDGQIRRGRCGSVNLCGYCAKLRAIENAEMLSLDALDHGAPEVWACLTTRSSDPAPSSFYRAREKVRKALRRRWPECEDATLVEFTTGYGVRAGGKRRPHWNALLKGVPSTAVEEALEVVGRVWCGQVDAEESRQHLGPVADAGGLMRYLALHFQKESQSPPKGWRGHRFVASRGYFPDGAPAARERAKQSLRVGRAVFWANAVAEGEWLDHGHVLDVDDLEQLIYERLAGEDRRTWSLKQVHGYAQDTGRAAERAAKEPFRRSR